MPDSQPPLNKSSHPDSAGVLEVEEQRTEHRTLLRALPSAADGDATDSSSKAISRAKHAIYLSHALSTWGQRSWEFAVGLLLLQLQPQSLALVSAYGLIDSGAQVLAGGSVGSYLSRTSRLRGAGQMYLLQNASIFASAAAIYPLLVDAVHSGTHFWVLISVAIGCGALSSIGSMGSTIAVEREWTKALCLRDSASLAAMNSGMRRIDLTCLIAAPIAVGFLLTYAGSQATVIALCIWNLVAWLPENLLLKYSMDQVPQLRDMDNLLSTDESPVGKSDQQDSWFDEFWQPWRLYMKQPVLPAAFALALLYLTVMSLGLLMTAYLKSLGMTEAILSLFRGIGAVCGVLATFSFPVLHRQLGLLSTGRLGIALQTACLWASILPSLLHWAGVSLPAQVQTYVLVTGVALSRFGLWTFDLTVVQLLQERVADADLNEVSGVQSSLQSFFGMGSYVVALTFSGLSMFPALMTGSCIVVLAAAIIYVGLQSRQEAMGNVLVVSVEEG